MNEESLRRLSEFAKSGGYDALLLANPANLTWLTGYAPPIQTGPSPFEGGPALGWFQAGELVLVMNDWEAGAAEALGAQTHPYSGYTIDEPLQGSAKQAEALREVLVQGGLKTGRVGVELDYLPAALLLTLQEALPGARLQPIQTLLTPLRAVKSKSEIEILRRAILLSDLAQEELVKNLQPGVSELELWAAVKKRIELEEGTRVPVLADLVAGARTAEIGGLPGSYSVRAGDTVMLDFVARHAGYWGDNSAGYFVGAPPPELKKAAGVVLESLRRGRDAIRPGVKAGDLDALVRSVIREAGFEPFPHHAGHGLGTTYHEEPRIVPNHPFSLAADMVMVLEPGIYLPGIGGVRFEDAFLVTPDGCEVLTHHLDDYQI